MKAKLTITLLTVLMMSAAMPALAAENNPEKMPVTTENKGEAPDAAPMQQQPAMPMQGGMMPGMMPGMMAQGAPGNQNGNMPMLPPMMMDVPACNAMHAEVRALAAEIKTLSDKIDQLEKASKK